MANKASVFTENLATIANISALATTALRKVANTQEVDLHVATESILTERITQRIAANLRDKAVR